MASFSVKRSRMQFENISSSKPYQWKSSLPDSGYKPSSTAAAFGHIPNEDVECKFQHLECSVHKMGMVVDFVQNDIMRLNRGMKDAALESGSIQKKAVVLERSLQEICKGQDDLKEIVENCIKINADKLNVMNSHSSILDEISMTLSAWPKQMEADIRLLQNDISSVLIEQMQGIIRAIRSSESRPAAVEMPDQSCTINKRPIINQMLEVNEKYLVNQTTEVNGRSLVTTTPIVNEGCLLNQTPVGNQRPPVNQTAIATERSLVSQTPVVNERPQVNQKPLANGRSLMKPKAVANGRPQMKKNPVASGQLRYSQRRNRNPQKSQISATQDLHTRSVCPAMDANSNMEGKVKAVRQNLVGSSCSLAPEHDDVSNRQVTHELTTIKEPVCVIIDSDDSSEGCVSSMILNAETADADSHLIKESTEDRLQIPMRRGEKKANVPVKGIIQRNVTVPLETIDKHVSAEGAVFGTARASDETGSGLWRTSGRDRRPSVRFHGPDWYG